MNRHILSRKTLPALAAACLISVALPAAPALAKTKVKAPATALEYKLDIPTIQTVDSSIDDATLRAIISGDVAAHADELAGLDAKSITIPTISVTYSAPGEDGTPVTGSFAYHDLVLSDVTDGVAGTMSLASIEVSSNDADAAFGQMSAHTLNIGAVLGLFGLVPAATGEDFETLYADFAAEGGTVSGPKIDCEIGKFTVAQFEARPLKHNFMDLMALATTMEGEHEHPSPENIGKIMRIYADILTAFKSSPIHFGGLDCAGSSDDGEKLAIQLGPITVDGYAPGTYPGLSIDGFKALIGKDGIFAFGGFVSKPLDLSGPIAVIAAAPENIDKAWLEANARSLIPAYGGLSFNGLAVDMPNPDAENERIKAKVAAFDLSLGAYVNGIPTDVKTSADHIVVDLPKDGADQLKQLADLGVTSLDLGFALDAAWNAQDETIALNKLAVTGANLATVDLSGSLGQVAAALFSTNEDEALATAMGIVIKTLKLNVEDAGLSDLILARASADQGMDAKSMRQMFSGLAQGTIISYLAGTAEAQHVGQAVSDFIAGTAKSLQISLTAKQEPGLGMVDFMAASDDPTLLIGKVSIDATAH